MGNSLATSAVATYMQSFDESKWLYLVQNAPKAAAVAADQLPTLGLLHPNDREILSLLATMWESKGIVPIRPYLIGLTVLAATNLPHALNMALQVVDLRRKAVVPQPNHVSAQEMLVIFKSKFV